ncbi:MAG TPA: hypothetical protein VGQ35_18460, partial [Dongiaceae bacterium]|nr:hypothetical protein [Dongiaceae bacterium]
MTYRWKLSATAASFAAVLAIAGCGEEKKSEEQAAAPAPASGEQTAATEAPAGNPLDALIAEAKKEGSLTTIALPHDWCNYGELIQTFKDKYGLQVNELNPDAGSGDEVEAIKAN